MWKPISYQTKQKPVNARLKWRRIPQILSTMNPWSMRFPDPTWPIEHFSFPFGTTDILEPLSSLVKFLSTWPTTHSVQPRFGELFKTEWAVLLISFILSYLFWLEVDPSQPAAPCYSRCPSFSGFDLIEFVLWSSWSFNHLLCTGYVLWALTVGGNIVLDATYSSFDGPLCSFW